jgi:hypothetical protein
MTGATSDKPSDQAEYDPADDAHCMPSQVSIIASKRNAPTSRRKAHRNAPRSLVIRRNISSDSSARLGKKLETAATRSHVSQSTAAMK